MPARKTGRYPAAEQVVIPDSNFAPGNNGRLAVVDHVTDGTAASAIARFKNPTQRVSSHFLLALSGHIYQFVSIYDTAFANGLSYKNRLWIDPEGKTFPPTRPGLWILLTPPTNPNFVTISIEEEGRPSRPRTAAQHLARQQLLRWLAGEIPSAFQPYVAGVNLIGHRDISPISRPNCPGPYIDLSQIAADANGPPPARHYEIVAPCAVLTSRAPDAPLASGPDAGQTRLNPGDRIGVGDVTNGWLWISPNTTDAPGIGFIPAAYARPL